MALLLFGKAEYRSEGGPHAQERKDQQQPGRGAEETIQAFAQKNTDEYQCRNRCADMREVGQGTQKITVYWRLILILPFTQNSPLLLASRN